MVQDLSASSRAWNRWGLSMGQTTSSCTKRLASSWPAMSSQSTPLRMSRISLHTSSRTLGSSFCKLSGSSPSGPAKKGPAKLPRSLRRNLGFGS